MLKASAVLLNSRLCSLLFPLTKYRVILLSIIAIGVVSAGYAFVITKNDAEQLDVEKFDEISNTAGLAILNAIESHTQSVLSMRDLYLVSKFVSKDEFARFNS